MKSTTRTPAILSTEHSAHGVKVAFDNGVTLKFAGRFHDDVARAEAAKYYRACVECGWTEAEMITAFAEKEIGITYDGLTGERFY